MSGQNTRPDRSATGTVREAALRHAANAARALGSSRPTDVDVHDARKEIKKSRAALRLLRGAMAETTFRREDAALRGAARALNAARDARVLLRTLDSLRRRRVALAKDKAAAALAAVLRRRQAQARHQLQRLPELLAGARGTLQQVQQRARHWRVGQHGWSALGPAFRRIYRAGRRAGHAARRRPMSRRCTSGARRCSSCAMRCRYSSRCSPGRHRRSAVWRAGWRIIWVRTTTWRCCNRPWWLSGAATNR